MSERSLIISSMGTRDKIIIAAVELFIQQGIARTTTKEIASGAGVSEGSIYRYFPSKDEMAWQIFENYHSQLAEQLKQSTIGKETLVDKVSALVECFLSLADKDWLMFKYYLTSQHTHISKVDNQTATPYKVVLSLIEDLVQSNQIKHKNSSVLAAMVMGAVHQVGINKIYARINGELSIHKDLVAQTIIIMLTAKV